MHHQPDSLRQRSSTTAHALEVEAQPEAAETQQEPQRCKICTIVTAANVADAIQECAEAATCGADVVELRLDYLDYFDPTVTFQHPRSV
jgi:Type I 3-dehydroquinase